MSTTNRNFFHIIKHFSRNTEQFPESLSILDTEFPPGIAMMFIEMFPLCHSKHEDFQADLS